MKPDEFGEFLKTKGLRMTRERETILKAVLGRKGHFDPEELHISLRQKGAEVSRASVYRTLPLLMEAGILEEVERSIDKHAHYELTYGREHHDHMLCLRCGKIIEFLSEELEEIQDALCLEHGFNGQSHTLEIKGLCKNCSSKNK